MNKLSKKQIYIIIAACMAILAAIILAVALIGDKDKVVGIDKGKVELNNRPESEELTADVKTPAEEPEAEAEKELVETEKPKKSDNKGSSGSVSSSGQSGSGKPPKDGDNKKPNGGSSSEGSSSGSSGSADDAEKPQVNPADPDRPAEPAKPEKPHTHTVSVGNTGKWFDSLDEAEAYYVAEDKKWADKCDRGEITYDEYVTKHPYRWEWKQCMCGKVTLSLYTLENQ